MNIGILPSKRTELSSTLTNSASHERIENKSRLGKFFERSLVARRLLLFVAMLGMCMLIGDGILTPAISGLSAIWNSHLFLLLVFFNWLTRWHWFLFWFLYVTVKHISWQYCQQWTEWERHFLLWANVSTLLFENWWFCILLVHLAHFRPRKW